MNANCHENWFNQCKTNSDCCSSNCFRGMDNEWFEGVCQPPASTEKSNYDDNIFLANAGNFGSQFHIF